MTGPVRGVGVLGGSHRGDDDFGAGSASTTARVAECRSRRRACAGGTRLGLQPEGRPTGNSTGRPSCAVEIRAKFGDLTAREITVVTPLVVLIILLGVYPQPVLDVINPTAERTMVDVGLHRPAAGH